MAALIEDYALLSDLQTGPLISWEGSLDGLCFPRFDSPSVFIGLIGSDEHGHWLLAPSEAGAVVVDRHYMESTFVLQTIWETADGQILVTAVFIRGRTGRDLPPRSTPDACPGVLRRRRDR